MRSDREDRKKPRSGDFKIAVLLVGGSESAAP
jgi:hypothetical protein